MSVAARNAKSVYPRASYGITAKGLSPRVVNKVYPRACGGTAPPSWTRMP